MRHAEEETYGYANSENLCEREGYLLHNRYGVAEERTNTRCYTGNDANGDGLANSGSVA